MATKKKTKSRKTVPSAQKELMFEEPPRDDKPGPKRRRKKRLGSGEVRTYSTKSGHTYELRRVK